MSGEMQLKIKIQIYCGDEIAMGPGKADLLDAIREHGSISAAGRAMEMSYRRAWLLVDAMNRCWQEPLVHTAPGRAEGSGAQLTKMGEQVLMHYRALQQTLRGAAQGKDQAVLSQLLLTEPRVSQKA
ncbi:winged helix-turn-helix domain-containing protein [Novosphingobium beihaiensis]|uniref:LysR family transcriptional regulator n=1 Tax=Novosphingobium beihaiensis TaxID=2930389 RepID=A0ABT0BRK9_9SPHN|nr:LysR family transcriptional regulator [Novosphingobium beihaiensis]MCJ2187274.1 LysR family transcriptional regulator [Novosphingobium beihaiensis]